MAGRGRATLVTVGFGAVRQAWFGKAGHVPARLGSAGTTKQKPLGAHPEGQHNKQHQPKGSLPK